MFGLASVAASREKVSVWRSESILAAKKGEAAASPLYSAQSLVQAEINFHVDLDGDRLTVFHRRFKGPPPYGFNRFLIESHA